MTDGRIPGKWVSEPRFAEMPDAYFGFLARAIAWSNEAGTDGLVKRRYLANLHSDGEQHPSAYAALEAAGLWTATADGYQFIGWDLPAHRGGMGQSPASAVQAGKQRNKDKQQRYRDRSKPASETPTPSSDPSRNPVTFEGYVGQDTTGQDRLVMSDVLENKDQVVEPNNMTPSQTEGGCESDPPLMEDPRISVDPPMVSPWEAAKQDLAAVNEIAPCCGTRHGVFDQCPDVPRIGAVA